LNKQLVINNFQDVDKYKLKVLEATENTVKRIKDLSMHKGGFELFHDLRFSNVGQDPLEMRPLNFVEQLNQTFTYLVSLQATEYLIDVHPEHIPFVLNLGTSPGFDIVSKNGLIIAEVFAATSPQSNQKLKKDCKRVADSKETKYRYVFYYSPDNGNVGIIRDKHPYLKIVQLDLKDIKLN
jgi:hypothetical protein